MPARAIPSSVPARVVEVPLHEARVRLTALARMTNLAGGVTILTDGGKPVAALVAVDAARSRQEAGAAAAQHEAAARGWQQRLETMRDNLRAQHQRRVGELQTALAAAWQVIDRLPRYAQDRDVEQLRAQHRDLR